MPSLTDILFDIDYIEYIDKFEEKKITGVILKTLTREEIADIVSEDDVDNFIKKLNALFAALDEVGNEPSQRQAVNEQQRPLAELNLNLNQQEVEAASIFVTENIDIGSILQSSYEGRKILKYYTDNKQLTKQHRKRLVWHVVSAVCNACTRELQEKDYAILRDKIIQLFPTEIGSIYFIPTQHKNKLTNTPYQKRKGKLVNKFQNFRRTDKYINSNTVNDDGRVNTAADENVSEDLQEKIDWLQINEEPWETTIENWTATYDYRKSKLGENDNKISSIYEQWNILKSPKAYSLIDIDFNKSQICTVKDAIVEFDSFFQKAYKVRPLRHDDLTILLKDLLENNDLNQDSKVLVQLQVLCLMLPSVAKIRQTNKKFWKPTSVESLDGMVLHVKIYGDIQKAKEDRRVYAVSKNTTVQPYIIVVGEEDYIVDSTYVCIDNIEYEMRSLLEGLDLCFKSFHTFNATYPPESEHIWLLFQLGLYQFRTKWDKTILNVDEILNDMRISLPATL